MLPPLQTHRRPAQIHRQPDRTDRGRRHRNGLRRLRCGDRHGPGPRRRRHHGPRRRRRRCGHQPVPPRRHRDRRRGGRYGAGRNTSRQRPPTPRHHDRRQPSRTGGIRHAPVGQGRGSRVCGSRLRLTGRRVRGRHDSVRCIRHKTIATSALCPCAPGAGTTDRPTSSAPTGGSAVSPSGTDGYGELLPGGAGGTDLGAPRAPDPSSTGASPSGGAGAACRPRRVRSGAACLPRGCRSCSGSWPYEPDTYPWPLSFNAHPSLMRRSAA